MGLLLRIRNGSWLRRLLADMAGNTLAMAAAAMIPLTALVGAGVDMSRAYMAQSKMQTACDAAALAGRRVMTAQAIDATVQNEALKFFRFNFPTGEGTTTPAFGVASFTPTVTAGDNLTVVVSASTTVPTTVMSMFGYAGIPISVDCNARLDFRNTDILMVLDVTGSMAWDPSGYNVNSGPSSRIVALRAAVLALYDALKPAQDQLEAAGLRLRYGIVPYSSNVNVGAAVRNVNSNYFVDSWTYQSREAVFNTPNYTSNAGSPVVDGDWELYNSGASISSSDCDKFGNNQSFSGFTKTSPASGGGPAPTATWAYSWVWEHGWTGAPDNSGSNKSCRRKRYKTTTTYTVTGYRFTNWVYKPSTYNVANFKSGGTITIATSTGGTVNAAYGGPSASYNAQALATLQSQGYASGFTTAARSWDGCVEERDTVSSITGWSLVTIPSGAYDLMADYLPDSQATRWRPLWDDIAYQRNSPSNADPTVEASSGSAASSVCPVAARRLQPWARADLSTYLNSLIPTGNTYHDFGMIWGARFISPTGIFNADNPTVYNNAGVDRYIIFMTDGELNTNASNYGMYGIEYIDQRVTGGYTTYDDQNARHAKRFSIACAEAKTKVNSIWVIAFASTLSSELTNCASSPDQASISANATQLTAKFVEIGNKIGALRLSK